jgi:hypothetical protein
MSAHSPSSLIAEAVGAGAVNRPDDVKTIEYLLNIVTGADLPEAGNCDERLVDAIRIFQTRMLGFRTGDGRVDPGGRTLNGLVSHARQSDHTRMHAEGANGTGHRVKTDNHVHAAAVPTSADAAIVTVLTDADYAAAAEALQPGVEIAMIHAFADVESGGRSGFGPHGLPKIAYEGHLFRQYTQHRYDADYPLLSYPYVTKAGPEWKANNKNQETAWATLNQAVALDRTAALSACSWGMFQVLGANFEMCGCSDVEAFVERMKSGARGHLDAFVSYCKKTRGLRDALAAKDFVSCARLYNGLDYGDYPTRLEQAFHRYGGA